jgi:SAM-dependent methyltransferase
MVPECAHRSPQSMLRTAKDYLKGTRFFPVLKCILRLYRRLLYGTHVGRRLALWESVSFWDQWLAEALADRDHPTRETFGCISRLDRLDPNLPLSDYHRRFIDHLPEQDIFVLDVGAGPLTTLGKVHPFKRLHITATDVLAAEFESLLKKYQLDPPVRTIYADAERLTDLFPANSFHLVNAENAIDHTDDALAAIVQMLWVVKEGCYVVLNHNHNEADHQNFEGLHQWNFTVVNGDFIIRRGAKEVNVTREIAPLGDCESELLEDFQIVRVHIRKKEGVTLQPRAPGLR